MVTKWESLGIINTSDCAGHCVESEELLWCGILSKRLCWGMYEVKSKSSVGNGDEAEGFRHQGINNGRCSTGRWYPVPVLC